MVVGMFVPAAIRILCEGTNPSLGTAMVNGLLAWAGFLGGCTVFCSGVPAAVALFIPPDPTPYCAGSTKGWESACSRGWPADSCCSLSSLLRWFHDRF